MKVPVVNANFNIHSLIAYLILKMRCSRNMTHLREILCSRCHHPAQVTRHGQKKVHQALLHLLHTYRQFLSCYHTALQVANCCIAQLEEEVDTKEE
jgi:hypothetical protein